jgi:hypothetical protein
MPILMGRVLVAFVRRPLAFPDGESIFALELEDAAGVARCLIARKQPDIFDAAQKPTILTTEIGSGSRVRVDARQHTMRAVQLLELHTRNPFQAPKPLQIDQARTIWSGLDSLQNGEPIQGGGEDRGAAAGQRTGRQVPSRCHRLHRVLAPIPHVRERGESNRTDDYPARLNQHELGTETYEMA